MYKRLSLAASASIVTQLQCYPKGQTHRRGICASVSGSEPAKRDTLAGGCAIAVRAILHAWNSWNLTIEPQSMGELRTTYKTWNRTPDNSRVIGWPLKPALIKRFQRLSTMSIYSYSVKAFARLAQPKRYNNTSGGQNSIR